MTIKQLPDSIIKRLRRHYKTATSARAAVLMAITEVLNKEVDKNKKVQ